MYVFILFDTKNNVKNKNKNNNDTIVNNYNNSNKLEE